MQLSKQSLIVFTLFLFGFTNIKAQKNIPFKKSNFKTDIANYKKALRNIQEGDFFCLDKQYSEALIKYNKANSFNPHNAELNAKIGNCYLYLSSIDKANKLFAKAFKLDDKLDGDYLLSYGKSYQMLHDFDNAIKQYEIAKTKESKINPDLIIIADKRIKECIYSKELLKTPINLKIEKLNSTINSENEEYVPVINADETELFFTSRRSNTTGGSIAPGLNDYYEDIYTSTKKNGKWTQATNIGKPVNSEHHDATVGLSLDGQKLFLYRDNEQGIGNILITERNGETWTTPKELPYPINSKHQETSACYSPDGQTIYFVSDRPEGKGGKDIYKASKNKDGEWDKAQNLSFKVNTPEDEDAIFLHADGKTLYFSSKGHPTMGGYDIYKTVFNEGEWSTPINMGYPLNSPDDDVCFVLAASGDHGYYTSIKSTGEGKRDIYEISFLDQLNKPKLTLIKGTVIDNSSGKKLSSKIEIYDNDADTLFGTFESNSTTGDFMISLPSGKNYGISVKSKGSLFYSENFNIPDSAAFMKIEKKIVLDKLEIGKKVVLNNIFFDYDKANLRASSHNELSKVVNLLIDNPNLKIELSTHTDSRGTETYNKKLSQLRAESCLAYLISQGIQKERIVAIGYGESRLNITDEEIEQLTTLQEIESAHQKNRRSEFKIIDNTFK